MNNCEYNILKQFMKSQQHYNLTPKISSIAMDLVNPVIDFIALGQSMGVPAIRVACAGDIAAAVEAGIASGKPNLIEIVIRDV